jgi:hypothetical protein
MDLKPKAVNEEIADEPSVRAFVGIRAQPFLQNGCGVLAGKGSRQNEMDLVEKRKV